ncbi:TIGR02679 family protein [Actinomadura sp. NAK00032]|uniref:TIGR02679 family protein n=1 Tax=Actinomadura sp. NAK00032 TaxID=2742128 RepID=UPI001590B171|nr:TIGR02679 family protein [Actinomadura sp. NAK00032]QKW34466.1 TIGR02679 family protein [Actinomadura sp. NAK00032]
MSVPDRLRDADLRPLWTELHKRFSTGAAVARITIKDLDGGQRAALADLLGMDRYPGSTVTVPVARLDGVLRELTGSDSRAVTESVLGPIGDRARERRERERERSALWEWLAAHPVVRGEPELARWVDDVRRQGLVMGSVPSTRTLLVRALKVLAALPSDGRPLQSFATGLFGDSHALDDGGRLSGLVLRAQAIRYGIEPPAEASDRRALWERSGVASDTLSTTVLVAGLRPAGDGVLARTLRMWADAGHATPVTLEQLRDSSGLRVDVPVVWVTENPTVLALAVRRFGARCPPLMCSSGWPNSAVIRLLRALGESGAALRYHGDFDGEGLRIAAHVMAKTGAVPWRMSSGDYLAALDGAEEGALPAPGRVGEAPWDPELALNMGERRAAVLEEKVADVLLGDLSGAITTCI